MTALANHRATCPLCGHARARRSWLGATNYLGHEFPYRECQGCGSLYCDPMPDAPTLAHMYGPEYPRRFAPDPAIPDPKEPHRVLEWLAKAARGTFVDYGCGAGALLAHAAELGWDTLGLEFDDDVARQTGAATGLRVLGIAQLDRAERPLANVLHLGDVIEHLTELERQMPEILSLLKPGGVLLAQGPLEANANLFTAMLRVARRLRPRRTEMAPYHVLLATAEGQRACFRRFGLEELEFTLSEVSWPAPARLALADLRRPRTSGLFLLRRLSQASSSLRPECWGNRYFFAGRWNPPATS
jgi:SAM-dependent methyltransferase